MQTRGRFVLAAVFGLALVFLYAPLAVVVALSFSAANTSAYLGEWTLQWYSKLLSDPVVGNAALNSLMLGLSSALAAVVVGGGLGAGLYRLRARRLGWIVVLVYLPLVTPDVVYGIADLGFFSRVHAWTGMLAPGFLTMFVAHVSFLIPVAALMIFGRLATLDRRLFEAAADLYAGSLQRIWFLTLPLLVPSLMAAFLVCFTLSVDDFVISFFTAGPHSTTLPLYVWSALKKGVTPEINAVATLMIGVVVVMPLLAALLWHAGVRLSAARPRVPDVE